MLPAKVESVVDLAQRVAARTYVPPPAFQRLYRINLGKSVAIAGHRLASKYGARQGPSEVRSISWFFQPRWQECSQFVSARSRKREASDHAGVGETSEQVVVCVTNQITGDQTWYNEMRTRKPQTFRADSAGPEDPIANPATECTKYGSECSHRIFA